MQPLCSQTGAHWWVEVDKSGIRCRPQPAGITRLWPQADTDGRSLKETSNLGVGVGSPLPRIAASNFSTLYSRFSPSRLKCAQFVPRIAAICCA